MAKQQAEPDKIPTPSAVHLQSEFTLLVAALAKEETEHTWEAIDKALKRFHAVVRGGACKWTDVFIKEMKRKEVVIGVIRSLITERTRLSSTTLDVMSSATRLGSSFHPLLPHYLPTILRLLCRTNKLYISRATSTLISIVIHTELSDILKYIVAEWKLEGGKSSSYRISAMEVVLAFFPEGEPLGGKENLDRRVEDIEWIVRQSVTDRESKVRSGCKKLWEYYRSIWDERVAGFTAPMTPISRKYLNINNSLAASTSHVGPAPAPAPKKQPQPSSSTSTLSTSTSSKPSRPVASSSNSQSHAAPSHAQPTSSVSHPAPVPHPQPQREQHSKSHPLSLSVSSSTSHPSERERAPLTGPSRVVSNPHPHPVPPPIATGPSRAPTTNTGGFKPTTSSSATINPAPRRINRAPLPPSAVGVGIGGTVLPPFSSAASSAAMISASVVTSSTSNTLTAGAGVGSLKSSVGPSGSNSLHSSTSSRPPTSSGSRPPQKVPTTSSSSSSHAPFRPTRPPPSGTGSGTATLTRPPGRAVVAPPSVAATGGARRAAVTTGMTTAVPTTKPPSTTSTTKPPAPTRSRAASPVQTRRAQSPTVTRGTGAPAPRAHSPVLSRAPLPDKATLAARARERQAQALKSEKDKDNNKDRDREVSKATLAARERRRKVEEERERKKEGEKRRLEVEKAKEVPLPESDDEEEEEEEEEVKARAVPLLESDSEDEPEEEGQLEIQSQVVVPIEPAVRTSQVAREASEDEKEEEEDTGEGDRAYREESEGFSGRSVGSGILHGMGEEGSATKDDVVAPSAITSSTELVESDPEVELGSESEMAEEVDESSPEVTLEESIVVVDEATGAFNFFHRPNPSAESEETATFNVGSALVTSTPAPPSQGMREVEVEIEEEFEDTTPTRPSPPIQVPQTGAPTPTRTSPSLSHSLSHKPVQPHPSPYVSHKSPLPSQQHLSPVANTAALPAVQHLSPPSSMGVPLPMSPFNEEQSSVMVMDFGQPRLLDESCFVDLERTIVEDGQETSMLGEGGFGGEVTVAEETILDVQDESESESAEESTLEESEGEVEVEAEAGTKVSLDLREQGILERAAQRPPSPFLSAADWSMQQDATPVRRSPAQLNLDPTPGSPTFTSLPRQPSPTETTGELDDDAAWDERERSHTVSIIMETPVKIHPSQFRIRLGGREARVEEVDEEEEEDSDLESPPLELEGSKWAHLASPAPTKFLRGALGDSSSLESDEEEVEEEEFDVPLNDEDVSLDFGEREMDPPSPLAPAPVPQEEEIILRRSLRSREVIVTSPVALKTPGGAGRRGVLGETQL
ncbi:hypothetical protein T439DRAFT_349587 [Meredithblackwellia eburnea MCA 4105]